MLKIVDLILEYKDTHKEKTAEEILNKIMPMINKKVKSIRADYKEDVVQDLKTNLFSIINIANYRNIELSVSLFSKDNLSFLRSKDYSVEAINLVFNNKFIKNYIDEMGIDILEGAFETKEKYQEFIIDFSKFSFRNQFFHILDKRFDTVRAAFYRNNIDYFNKEQMMLNWETDEGDEFIDLIPDNSQQKISFEKLGFSEKDIKFLSLFIDGDKVYSQTEVAKRLGTSQQYVSKRIREIRRKYKHLF